MWTAAVLDHPLNSMNLSLNVPPGTKEEDPILREEAEKFLYAVKPPLDHHLISAEKGRLPNDLFWADEDYVAARKRLGLSLSLSLGLRRHKHFD